MSAIHTLQNRILVTDYADRPFIIPQEIERAFNEWIESDECEWDPDAKFAEYRVAGEAEGEGLPPIDAAFKFHPGGYLIPREKNEAFELYSTAKKDGKLEQYLKDGGEDFEKYAGDFGVALFRSYLIEWSKLSRVN